MFRKFLKPRSTSAQPGCIPLVGSVMLASPSACSVAALPSGEGVRLESERPGVRSPLAPRFFRVESYQ